MKFQWSEKTKRYQLLNVNELITKAHIYLPWNFRLADYKKCWSEWVRVKQIMMESKMQQWNAIFFCRCLHFSNIRKKCIYVRVRTRIVYSQSVTTTEKDVSLLRVRFLHYLFYFHVHKNCILICFIFLFCHFVSFLDTRNISICLYRIRDWTMVVDEWVCDEHFIESSTR